MYTKHEKRIRRAKKAANHQLTGIIRTKKGKWMLGQKQGTVNAMGAFGKRPV
jgi:hypothetical protein